MSFGTDTWCYDQVFTGRLATGVDVLAQAIFRRLNTARGTLRDGEEGSVYGLDVLDFVGQVGESAVAVLPDAVVAEILKDDRVARAEAFAAKTTSPEGLDVILLDVDVFPADEDSPFRLSLSISSVDVALLGVTPEAA